MGEKAEEYTLRARISLVLRYFTLTHRRHDFLSHLQEAYSISDRRSCIVASLLSPTRSANAAKQLFSNGLTQLCGRRNDFLFGLPTPGQPRRDAAFRYGPHYPPRDRCRTERPSRNARRTLFTLSILNLLYHFVSHLQTLLAGSIDVPALG